MATTCSSSSILCLDYIFRKFFKWCLEWCIYLSNNLRCGILVHRPPRLNTSERRQGDKELIMLWRKAQSLWPTMEGEQTFSSWQMLSTTTTRMATSMETNGKQLALRGETLVLHSGSASQLCDSASGQWGSWPRNLSGPSALLLWLGFFSLDPAPKIFLFYFFIDKPHN